MSDRTHYENLMTKWREKEAIAELFNQFSKTGGTHRLKIKVEHPDQVVASQAERMINDTMSGSGFATIVRLALKQANDERDHAREAFLHEAGAAYLTPTSFEEPAPTSNGYPAPPKK
ncbi:hypothetical protein [Brucella pseudogrignonensis]|uniref:Uncharacterized protein n=1 Tax=Brucella pseudogrignonensis TaxID=419475 RepID=A0ABU1M5S4_9HYPH|nr:hypothetical protein [Brucella pseudogrignonensis]MDR6431253.1 hypothetical protein [Brucella pseudogrignonensis]